VSFAVAADAYDRFMGRYSEPLAAPFADFAGIADERQVLDVGCGPGALTAELVKRLGSSAVSAVDPSESFVEAARERFPDVTVRRASAEELPFAADAFDAALAQLVVHFMEDPVAGLREMGRVTRPGGVVAACVWDLGEHGEGPLGVFWAAVRDVDPAIGGESHLPGTLHGQLAGLSRAAGLRDVEDGELTISLEHTTFEDWWEPFTLGVGPAGAYVARLDAERLAQLRESCRNRLPTPPFVLSARAWAVRGRASARS
jgi:SAM-dependent methyltransferase